MKCPFENYENNSTNTACGQTLKRQDDMYLASLLKDQNSSRADD